MSHIFRTSSPSISCTYLSLPPALIISFSPIRILYLHCTVRFRRESGNILATILGLKMRKTYFPTKKESERERNVCVGGAYFLLVVLCSPFPSHITACLVHLKSLPLDPPSVSLYPQKLSMDDARKMTRRGSSPWWLNLKKTTRGLRCREENLTPYFLSVYRCVISKTMTFVGNR